tara:strand:- start:103 stop:219 length:117 start_codon:yes stop_codon:yes gene_type:complete
MGCLLLLLNATMTMLALLCFDNISIAISSVSLLRCLAK